MSSMLDFITSAARKVQLCGIAETLDPEDLAVALSEGNDLLDSWNTRRRNAVFERMQTFPVTTSAASYTIGAATNTPTPTFSVATGNRPAKIDYANWIIGTGTSAQSYPVEVITVQNYRELYLPAFTGGQPYGMYYQPTMPNGTLWTVPYPTVLVNSLQLFWWDQLLQVDIANITSTVLAGTGFARAYTLTLAEALCIPFGKTLTEQLEKEASKARADYQSLNSSPPKLDTSGDSCRRANGVEFGW